MKNPFNETHWLNLHWYYCKDLGRNLLRRITSMPVSFSNLIWSNLNLLKSTKLIGVWRSHLGVNGTALSGEGIFHGFSYVLHGVGSMQLQAKAPTPDFSLQNSLETGPCTWCKGLMGKALTGETKLSLQAVTCYSFTAMNNMSRFKLSIINVAYQISSCLDYFSKWFFR